ncbi:MAG: phytanoyl-CoA dioxygenase family protein [Myxococcota bacterium]
MSRNSDRVDFHEYHGALPDLLASGRGEIAARGARDLGSIGIRLADADGAYTYTPTEAGIEISAGVETATTAVEMECRYWEGLVHDLESAPGLLYGGFVKGLRGDLMNFVRWEPSLRAIYRGRVIYDPDRLDLRGRSGEPLDPSQSFSLADDDAEMAHFLQTIGYVLIRGVFSDSEVKEMCAEARSLREAAVDGDGQSWWGKGDDGRNLLCRVINAGTRKRLADLYDDTRIVRLSQLPREQLVGKDRNGTNGVTILWKQPGVVEGLGDLPWHRDCGMGGHSVMCPAINCSIYLGPANPDAGDLRFLPGSWETSVGFADGEDENAPRGISIDARPGDVSLHYGDVFHAAPPPLSETGPFRTSVLIGWGKPGAEHHRGAAHYNDALFQDGGADVPDVREMARRRSEER